MRQLTLLTTLLTLTLLTNQNQAADDAIQEANQHRTQHGLHPFQHDEQLTTAAKRCADIRAANHIRGHLTNDYAYLPPGAHADATGCGALTPDWGWATCCMDDNYTYAGAAITIGNDGRRYMHLFVSNTPNYQTTKPTPARTTAPPTIPYTTTTPQSTPPQSTRITHIISTPRNPVPGQKGPK